MPALRRRSSLLLLAPLLVVLTLAGCSSDDGGLKLVDTKSPVQLLRNEAWSRLPALVVKGDTETADLSMACDESGVERHWLSRTTALMNNSFAPRTAKVAKDLVDSFTQQDWEVQVSEDDITTEYLLTKLGSVAEITVVAVERTSEHRASISITITGPCVATDGPDSDEVRALEGRS